MTVHILHIGKTGGSAIGHAIRSLGQPQSPYGPIVLQRHAFKLWDVPPDDHTVFILRDPITRFISSFYSRKRRGQPLYYFKWTAQEQRAFEIFSTPRDLAYGLRSADRRQRRRAVQAMRSIRHVGQSLAWTLGSPKIIERHLHQIVFIARQESLNQEWPSLRRVLALPEDLSLSSDPNVAHRGSPDEDRSLDEHAVAELREWYAKDYRILDICEALREERGWARAEEPREAMTQATTSVPPPR